MAMVVHGDQVLGPPRANALTSSKAGQYLLTTLEATTKFFASDPETFVPLVGGVVGKLPWFKNPHWEKLFKESDRVAAGLNRSFRRLQQKAPMRINKDFGWNEKLKLQETWKEWGIPQEQQMKWLKEANQAFSSAPSSRLFHSARQQFGRRSPDVDTDRVRRLLRQDIVEHFKSIMKSVPKGSQTHQHKKRALEIVKEAWRN